MLQGFKGEKVISRWEKTKSFMKSVMLEINLAGCQRIRAKQTVCMKRTNKARVQLLS
jgi:hypothetical protein